eukprot:scaffold9903_cov30-Tisochrysis_lutea.AAC.9
MGSSAQKWYHSKRIYCTCSGIGNPCARRRPALSTRLAEPLHPTLPLPVRIHVRQGVGDAQIA